MMDNKLYLMQLLLYLFIK